MTEEIAVEEKRNISTEERNRASESDFAGPHRSFPILKPADVMAAFHSLGRAGGDTGPIRAAIIRIAERKGFPLPKSVEDAKKAYHEEFPILEGEKCDMCAMPMEMSQPFGGAITFKELEDWELNQAMAHYADETTYQFKALMNNILEDDMLNAGQKSSAMATLTKEYQDRIGNPDSAELNEEKSSEPGFWSKFLRSFHKKQTKTLENENTVSLPANRGFKVYRDLEGDLRWLSLSSNAFEDLDRELFTTKALEEAIEHADKTGERGPLLIYHVPSAEVGQCDYQAMAGRFLVESGTFDDTPLGRKAVEYFSNTDEEHQVSIGYQYHPGDEEDGVYDWTRIIERSVTPFGAAANPWTDFKVIGENPMDERKAATLEKIFGKELAASVISSAEERTKELEATTKFKEVKEGEPLTITVTGSTLEELEAALKEAHEKASKKPMTPEEEAAMEKKPMMKKESETDPKPDQEPVPAFSPEQFTQLATLITDLSTQVEELTGLSETVKELQTQVKELTKTDEQKILEVVQPRWKMPNGERPSESDKNLITDEKAKKELQIEDDRPADPALAYVEDLLGGRAVASS